MSGKATVDGRPLTKATICFAPDKDNQLKDICYGECDDNGVYNLTTGGKTGAPVGWYKVYVTHKQKKGEEGTSPVRSKYLSAAKTPFSVEVVENPKPGAYDFAFTSK